MVRDHELSLTILLDKFTLTRLFAQIPDCGESSWGLLHACGARSYVARLHPGLRSRRILMGRCAPNSPEGLKIAR